MDEVPGGHRAGLSRRDLIKRGAIAGGLVWTAPVILSITDKAAAMHGSPGECDPGKYYAAKLDGGTSTATCTSVPNNSQDCSAVTAYLGQVPSGNNGSSGACSQLTRTTTTYNGFAAIQVTVPSSCKILGACAKYGNSDPCAVTPVDDHTVYFFLKSGANPPGQCGGTSTDTGTGLSHYELVWCCS